MEVLESVGSGNGKFKYVCKKCNTICSRKTDMNRHFLTAKHKNYAFGSILEGLKVQNASNCAKSAQIAKDAVYICVCKREYVTHSGLWKHKKKCAKIEHNKLLANGLITSDKDITDKEFTDKEFTDKEFTDKAITDKGLILELLKQNNEFKQQIMELVKKEMVCLNTTNNNINNTINNNQSFNMNIFLNEECKDALNIGEFVSSLPLSLEDLENTGRNGYVKGITDIVVRNLREMDVHKRPIHCSDLKREVMYVKDNDVWHKDEDNVKVKKAIQNIGTRNYRQVKEWIEKHPEAKDIHTKKHEQYVQIRIKCTGGSNKEEDDKMQNKILSSIAKVVHIDKQNI